MTIDCCGRGGQGLANGLDMSGCLRAASTELTRWNQKPSIILISVGRLYASPAAHTPHKLVDNLHIPAHFENANEHVSTRLAYAKKSTLPSQVPTHTYADCEMSVRHPTQLAVKGLPSSTWRWSFRKKRCSHVAKWIGWLQAGQSYAALGPMAAGWVSCKQIAHAGGSAAAVVAVAGGVVAPCVVQNGGVSLVKSTSVSVCETL